MKDKEALTPRQIEFLKNYLDPKSKTFSNVLQSAIRAGYSQEYSENLTNFDLKWLSENIGKKKKLVDKAENNLDELLGSKDERVKADLTKFTLSRLKKEDYSERNELTGRDGEALPTPIIPINVLPDNSNGQNNQINKEN